MIRDNKLLIFENFKVDRRLPKFNNQDADKRPLTRTFDGGQVQGSMPMQSGTLIFSSSSSTALTTNTVGNVWMTSNPMSSEEWEASKAPTAKKTFWEKVKALRRREPKPVISIHDFFLSIKNSVEEIKKVEERAAGYEAVIKRAMESGQTALLENLKDGLEVARLEAQMYACGFGKYVEEESIVNFSKMTSKGLDLIWLENFARVIPEGVIAKKMLADSKFLFDNYVVLAYDPKGVAKKDTKEEIERKKDPILFGVIKDSRRLYYIGDWIDELCDLTLDQLAAKMGDGVVRKL